MPQKITARPMPADVDRLAALENAVAEATGRTVEDLRDDARERGRARRNPSARPE